MDYDLLLPEVGDFGLYQKFIICVVLLPTVLPCAFQAYSQLFIAARPSHWCRVLELRPWAIEYSELVKRISVPFSSNHGAATFAECAMYNHNYSQILEEFPHLINNELDLPNATTTVPCKNGWHYDQSLYSRTVVSDVRG